MGEATGTVQTASWSNSGEIRVDPLFSNKPLGIFPLLNPEDVNAWMQRVLDHIFSEEGKPHAR